MDVHWDNFTWHATLNSGCRALMSGVEQTCLGLSTVEYDGVLFSVATDGLV